MAKQSLSPRRLDRLAAAMLISLAIVGCGTANAQPPRPAPEPPASFNVAPVEGSPEQTAADYRRAADIFIRVAPIEWSPEATAFEFDR